LTILQMDVDPSTGDTNGRTHTMVAVSQSDDPRGNWSLFSLDTTDDGLAGTPKHASCPCLGDQPLIGADKNGFYITTNEFGVGSEVYGQPPDAAQKAGVTPLGTQFIPSQGGGSEKLEFLSANDDRMNQAFWAAGKLWGAVNTVVKTPNGPTRVGVAWFALAPSQASGRLQASVAAQGYVSLNGQSVMYPSIAVNAAGRGAMTFTVVGPDFHPSAGYATIDGSGVGDVHVAAAGAAPEDGF